MIFQNKKYSICSKVRKEHEYYWVWVFNQRNARKTPIFMVLNFMVGVTKGKESKCAVLI